MNRIIREKNANYTTISNVFLKDKNISLKAKGLLAIVMSLPDNWDFSVSGLIKIIKEGKEATNSTIKELINFGYCTRKLCKEANGKFAGYDYTFYEEPQSVLPVADFTVAENPFTANPQQLNTNIINNLNNKDIEKEENEFSLSLSSEFKKYLIGLENYPLCKKIGVQLTDKNLTEILKEFEFEQVIEALEIIESMRNVKSKKNLNLTIRKILKNNFGGGKEFQRDLKEFKQVYIDWYISKNNKPPKLTKNDNIAAIELFNYLKESSKAKNSFGAIENFKYIFENLKKVEPFYQNQIKFYQINNNITILINQIKNGYATKQSNTKQSIQDYARTSINSQTRDYSEPAF